MFNSDPELIMWFNSIHVKHLKTLSYGTLAEKHHTKFCTESNLSVASTLLQGASFRHVEIDML